MKSESLMQHIIYEINLDKDVVHCLQDVMSGILMERTVSSYSTD